MIRCQLLLIFLAGQVLAAAKWQHDDAELRLRANVPSEGRCMQVPLPPNLGAYLGVRAMLEDGTELPTQPLFIGKTLTAVVVNHSPSFRGGFASEYVEYEYNGEMRKRRRWKIRPQPERDRPMQVYLYLLPDADSAAPPAVLLLDGEVALSGLAPWSPVACSFMRDTMVGRPATASEYRDLARRGERDRPRMNGDWLSFGDSNGVGLSGFKISQSNKHFMHIHLESSLVVDSADPVRISVENGRRPSAWYLFVNHQPAASWTESPPGDTVELPALTLAPGIHPISLFIISRSSESLPELHFPAGSNFATPHRSTGLVVEERKSVLTPGISIAAEERFAFDRTRTELARFRLFDLSANLLEGKITRTRVDIDGIAAEFAEDRAELIVPLRTSHKLALETADDHGFTATLNMPLVERIDGVTLLDADFDVLRLPTMLPTDGQLSFDYSLSWPAKFPAEFIAAARVRVVFRSSAGEEIANSAHVIPESPFKRQLALTVPPAAKSAEVSLSIAGQPIAPVQSLRFAEFADANLAFRASGDRLRIGHDFAILRPVTGDVARAPGQSVIQVALVDDFVALRDHISDDLSINTWLEQQGLQSSHHRVLGELATRLPHLRKYEFLGQLLASDVDAIVWAVGHEELAHGLHLRPFTAEMRFVVAACLQAGKLPILVSPPANLEIDSATLRPYALALKELAVTYGVPIADAYSASIRKPELGQHKQLDDAHSASLDAAGREWLLSQILRAIRRAGS
ncbi:MAG: hypothetical protein ACI8W8_000770 [Rhodothermales bacterium]|jgi:hypothetical protein